MSLMKIFNSDAERYNYPDEYIKVCEKFIKALPEVDKPVVASFKTTYGQNRFTVEYDYGQHVVKLTACPRGEHHFHLCRKDRRKEDFGTLSSLDEEYLKNEIFLQDF